MTHRFVVAAIASTALAVATLPAFGQGQVRDRNASNNPEIYQQTHPEDRSNPQLQGPAPARAAERPAQREQRHDGRVDGGRRDQDRREAHRNEGGHRHAERPNWDRRAPDRRDHGYVAPRPSYYGAPAVIFSAPPVYYGGVPQTYYPAYNSARVVRPGDYVPPEYLSPQFAVQDWYWRGLSQPPYGYQWVLLGPDHYALVAMSTGQIVSLMVAR